jgi:hypothetical protein
MFADGAEISVGTGEPMGTNRAFCSSELVLALYLSAVCHCGPKANLQANPYIHEICSWSKGQDDASLRR